MGADDCIYMPPEFAAWQRQWPDRILHASQFDVNRRRAGTLVLQDSSDASLTSPMLPENKQLRPYKHQGTSGEKKIVIVGGGLTAGTLARALSERGHRVVLIARKQLKTAQFDFPPVWLGPKALAEFASEPDFHRRYETIQQVRGEGSLTPDIAEALKNAQNIDIYPETCIRNISAMGECKPAQELQIETTRGLIVNVFCIILATGYQFNLRRYRFLRELISQHQIPLVCGLPQLDNDLQLQPIENLFGSGTIAQLQLGPAAGNIAGASLAYERLREKILPQILKTV